MQVFELRYPGAFLDGLTKDVCHQVGLLLSVLESHLTDAAVGLALYQEAQVRLLQQPHRPAWLRRRDAVRTVENEMPRQVPPAALSPDEFVKHMSDIHAAADLQVRRAEWAAGQAPDSYMQHLVFIHARTVLYALDGISKALGVLADTSGVPLGVKTAKNAYDAALPDLVGVRDSSHHVEDRARSLSGQGKKKKPVPPLPGNNRLIITNGLRGNQFGHTLADGRYGEVDISATSVETAQTAIQSAFDALAWHGPSRTVPF